MAFCCLALERRSWYCVERWGSGLLSAEEVDRLARRTGRTREAAFAPSSSDESNSASLRNMG